MPGLVVIVSKNATSIDLDLAQAMRDAIRHRDWYKVDDYVSPKGTAAISRVHLGITNKERQPYAAADGSVKLFLHGEIYNDEALDGNPLEYVYQLYAKKGIDFASSLNGSFIIVIVDEEEDTVLVANDRLATKPIFYFDDNRVVYFGPEMKSLFLTPTLSRKLNLGAVADFLTNGYFTREHTLVEGLETVDAGTVIKVTRGGTIRHTYWEHPCKHGYPLEHRERSQAYYQERLDELLHKAVRRRIRTGNSYGILLSGGHDSRGILGYYLEEVNGQPLNTISWGREEDVPGSDCAVAKRLAQKLGADHRFYKLTGEEVFDSFREFVVLGEGLTAFPESYAVFHRIREQQGVDIVLRGDLCFASQKPGLYDEHTMLRKLGVQALRNMPAYQGVLKPEFYRGFCELDADNTSYISSRCSATRLRDRYEFFYVDIELKNYLNPLNYVKNFALESFTPWLDFDIVDFVCRLPIKYRRDKNLYRSTVSERFPELFEEVAHRHNMIDWAASFRGSPALKAFIYRELLDGQNVFNEFVDIDSLRIKLDAFFSTPPSAASGRAVAFGLMKRWPVALNLALAGSYHIRKGMGKVKNSLPNEQLVIRLLILKVWGDVFLNYPMATQAR